MRLTPSSRIVLNALPGTVLDVVSKTRLPEETIRARIAELQRASLAKRIGWKQRDGRGQRWAIYETA